MQKRRPVISKFPMIVLTVCLGIPGTARVFAAADPSDELSVSNGAQLYELYCGDCHGNFTGQSYDELYGSDATDVSEDYAELVETVRSVKAPEPQKAPQEDWPEWAEFPPPEAEPDMRQEVIGTVSRAIDEVNGVSTDPEASDDEGDKANYGSAEKFEPAPGVTNLADPAGYSYGTSEEDLFNSIANGTGTAMPGWRTELGSDEAIWDLVNYIRSLWGDEWKY